jgi:ribosome biogenesis GTPase A
MNRPGEEVVIGVMGVTGVGKSTFIKSITQNKDIIIGHRIFSGTFFVKA